MQNENSHSVWGEKPSFNSSNIWHSQSQSNQNTAIAPPPHPLHAKQEIQVAVAEEFFLWGPNWLSSLIKLTTQLIISSFTVCVGSCALEWEKFHQIKILSMETWTLLLSILIQAEAKFINMKRGQMIALPIRRFHLGQKLLTILCFWQLKFKCHLYWQNLCWYWVNRVAGLALDQGRQLDGNKWN